MSFCCLFSGQSPTPIETKTHETKLRVLKCFVISNIKRSAIIGTSDLGKGLQEKSAEAAPAATVLSASKRGEKLGVGSVLGEIIEPRYIYFKSKCRHTIAR